jgi:hypothetical protein
MLELVLYLALLIRASGRVDEWTSGGVFSHIARNLKQNIII